MDGLEQRGAERKQSAVGKGVIALPGGETLQNGEEKRFFGGLDEIHDGMNLRPKADS